MNKSLMEKGFIAKMLLLLCVLGVSFCFAADLGDAVVNGFFKVIREYILYIVIGVIIVVAGGFIWGGVEWKFVLIVTIIAISAWVIAADKSTIDKIISGTRTLTQSLF